MTTRFTTDELAKAGGISIDAARGLIAFLRETDTIKLLGVVRSEGVSKGRGANQYEITHPDTALARVQAVLSALK